MSAVPFTIQLFSFFAVALGGDLLARTLVNRASNRRSDRPATGRRSSVGRRRLASVLLEVADALGADDGAIDLGDERLDEHQAQVFGANLTRRARELSLFETDVRRQHEEELKQLHTTVASYEQMIKRLLGGVADYVGDPTVKQIAAEATPQRSALEGLVSATQRQLERLHTEMEELRRTALLDGLTGVPNRRAFDAELDRLVGQCKQGNGVLCVAMLDVDHFKKFNDTHGHLGGDAVLKTVAYSVNGAKGKNAYLARYGGEEFAVLFEDVSFDRACETSQHILAAIAGAATEYEGLRLNVTASLGVAEWRRGESGDALMQRADEALYAAKCGGRARGYYHDGRETYPLVQGERPLESGGSGRNRRRAERRPFHVVQPVAPYYGGGVPSMDAFMPVEFCDLSLTGCSFLLPEALDTRRVLVALGAEPHVKYVVAQIVHCHRDSENGGFRVGCCFTSRIR